MIAYACGSLDPKELHTIVEQAEKAYNVGDYKHAYSLTTEIRKSFDRVPIAQREKGLSSNETELYARGFALGRVPGRCG